MGLTSSESKTETKLKPAKCSTFLSTRDSSMRLGNATPLLRTVRDVRNAAKGI